LLSLETTDPSKEEPADTDIPQLRKQYRSLVAQLSASGTWEEDYATTADLVDGESPLLRIIDASEAHPYQM
jgi:hypothetical protein